jgi:hypothetical protein
MSDAANRALWTVIGLLLLLAGVAGGLANRGWLPGLAGTDPLLWPGLLSWWRRLEPWGLVGIGLLGLAGAVLGLILLGSELRGRAAPALGELRLAPGRAGRTRVRGQAVGQGLARDLARDPGIRAATVAVTGAAPRPELWLRLDVEQPADLSAVRERVAAALARFSRTYGLWPCKVDVTARMVGPPPARVR